MSVMQENFNILGGLPRYLVIDKANKRKTEITPDKANAHAQALLDALAAGSSFSDSSTDKFLSKFFTLRVGKDEKGEDNPLREYAKLAFVSPGAAKAAGKIIITKINKDVHWRNVSDSSEIGLAFERAVLIFLSQGTEGMNKLGIRTRCRQLLQDTTKKRGRQEKSAAGIRFSLGGNSEHLEESPDDRTFEQEVRNSGKGMSLSGGRLQSKKSILFPPSGYTNFDGLAGADLGFNATLQKTHGVSGPEYIRQRHAFGLTDPNDPFAHVFVVPKSRFDSVWTSFQQLQWSDDDDGDDKTPKVDSSSEAGTAASATSKTFGARKKACPQFHAAVCADARIRRLNSRLSRSLQVSFRRFDAAVKC